MTHFTIVIPTRERCETLYYSIRACLEQDYDDFTVLVSDNVSRDATQEVVRSFTDARLIYVSPPQRLSMSSHFNFAIGRATGDWITSIGDDDALLPGALVHAAELIRGYGGLPISAPSVLYGWPQLPDMKIANRIRFREFGDGVSVRSAREVIQKRISFRERREGYVWGLAGVYRGFIPSTLIKGAMISGRYINSVTPDAYSAFSTGLLSPTYVHTERPLFIEGISIKSNGAAQLMLDDSDEERKYIAENDMPINESTVYCPASSFVMIEAFLQVKRNFPELAAGLEPDFRRMCTNAKLEASLQKMPVVQSAIDELCSRQNIRHPTRVDLMRERFLQRCGSLRRAIAGLSVDGNVLGIRNVHDASIAAGAIWNYRRKHGVRGGVGLLVDGLARALGPAAQNTRQSNR